MECFQVAIVGLPILLVILLVIKRKQRLAMLAQERDATTIAVTPQPSLSAAVEGTTMRSSMVYCRFCGKELHESAVSCPHCGGRQRTSNASNLPKSRVTAGVLGLLLGGIGLHKFYVGSWGWGIVYVVFVWTWIPAILGLIEGVHYLMLSDEEFTEKASQLEGAFSFLW
jgi:TM2 domain-containing membrane protein YozV